MTVADCSINLKSGNAKQLATHTDVEELKPPFTPITMRMTASILPYKILVTILNFEFAYLFEAWIFSYNLHSAVATCF